MEITTEYLKTRKQFGVAIGSFQALAAPRLRHGRGARAGAQHGDVRDDVAGEADAERTRQGDVGGEGADRPLRPSSSASRRRNCMAASR